MNQFDLDLELEQFVKAAEKNCHKFKQTNIEWSPYAGVWLHQQLLLACIQQYLSGKTRDPRNLIHNCRRCGVSDPWLITQDEF